MISAYLVDDIIIIKSGGTDSWNEPLATTEKAVKGRVEYETRLIKNLQGEEVVSSAKILLSYDEVKKAMSRELEHADVLKFDGVEHSILTIAKPQAFSGPHLEVRVE